MKENLLQNRKLPQKKHKFREQISILDYDDPNSELNQSNFSGFYGMIFILIIFYLGGFTIRQFYMQGQFMNYNLYNEFRNDFFIVIGLWLVYFLFPIFSYLNIKLLLKSNCKTIYSKIIQHIVQSLMFAGTYFLLESQKFFFKHIYQFTSWCTSHRAFLILLCCSTFMKMHSYAMTNIKYYVKMKSQSNQNKKVKNDNSKIKKVKFPDNLNMKDFFTYLLMPVLVYEKNFLIKTTPMRISYLLKKAGNCLIYLVGLYTIAADNLLPVINIIKKIILFSYGKKLKDHKLQFFVLFGVQLDLSYYLNQDYFILFLNCFQILELNCYSFFYIIINLEQDLQIEDIIMLFGIALLMLNIIEIGISLKILILNLFALMRPVHEFLYRHVYIECIYTMKISESAAKFWTFAFSACIHEFVAYIIWQKLTGILLLFMLFQIPLMYWTKNMQGKKSGNLLFWFGIIFGAPLICGLYMFAKFQVPLF